MLLVVNATLGTCVLLQCILPHHPTLKNTRVYWQTKRNGGKLVHYYHEGKEELDHQNATYWNRTALDPNQLASGNFSLLLCNLTKQDNNTSFYCLHATTAKWRPTQISQITLQLQEPIVPATDSKPPSVPWWTWVILAIFLIVLLALGIFCYVRRWRRTGTERIARGTRNETDNGTATGTGTSIAATNGMANGTANGIPNGEANGPANETVKKTADDSNAALIDNKEAGDLEMTAKPLLEDRNQDG